MNLRFCTVRSDNPNANGDCLRACIATMIDRDDVPHVFQDYKEGSTVQAYAQLREYLKHYGKTFVVFAIDDHAEFMAVNNPGVPYLLLCSTARGIDHAVICRDGKKIHDPAWYGAEITGPHSMGFYVIGIIGDLI